VNGKLQIALTILAAVALFFILAIIQLANTRFPVYGAFGPADVISSSEVRIQMTVLFSEKDYSGYTIVVDPPAGGGADTGGLEGWDLGEGVTFHYNSTLRLCMVDSDSIKGMSEGDCVKVESVEQALASGQWNLTLFHEGTDIALSDAFFTI